VNSFFEVTVKKTFSLLVRGHGRHSALLLSTTCIQAKTDGRPVLFRSLFLTPEACILIVPLLRP